MKKKTTDSPAASCRKHHRTHTRKSFQDLNLCDDFLFAKTMQFSWSVRQLEAAAKNAQTEKKEKPEPVALPIEYEELTERLRRATGLKVKLEGTQEKGKIVLQYTSEEELQRLWEWMEK